MGEGWICLHRALRENPRYRDSAWVHVWVDMLLGATHAEQPALFGGRRITLTPGQLITGRKSISDRTGVHESKVQRVLKAMEVERQIEQRMSNASRLITIVNWRAYQWKGPPTAQPGNSERTTPERPLNTNNTENKRDNGNTPPKGDATYRILVECPQLRALTYEQDLRVRQDFGATPRPLDWERLAECTVTEALLMTEPIRNPAMFWRRQIQKQVDTEFGPKKRARAVDDETATDRLAREFIQ